MLRELRIRNLAVIEEIAVPLAPGFNVLTGETGAGKSILVDALLLIIGARAQPELIRSGEESAVVEALFEVETSGPVAALLDESGHRLADGQLVVKRELSRSGRHRVFVNDSAATVGLLERLGDLLVGKRGRPSRGCARSWRRARARKISIGFSLARSTPCGSARAKRRRSGRTGAGSSTPSESCEGSRR